MILSIYSTYCPELNSWNAECLYEFEGETKTDCYMQFKKESDDLARVFSSAFDIFFPFNIKGPSADSDTFKLVSPVIIFQ